MTFNGTNGSDRLDVSEIEAFSGFARFGSIASSEFTRRQNPVWESFDSAPRLVADVNGDGRADIIGFGPNAVAVALGQADGAFAPARVATRAFTTNSNSAWESFDSAPRQVADVNGDGRADIIGFGPNAVAVALGQANGTFGAARVATRAFTPNSNSAWESFDSAPRQVADVNGDGRADIIGFGPDAVAVALGQANGTFGAARVATRAFTPNSNSAWESFDSAPRQVADVNGDGRADIIGFGPDAVAVALGQANGTFGAARVATRAFTPNSNSAWESFDSAPRQVADINGDGRADIIGFGPRTVAVALGQANGTFGSASVATRDFAALPNSQWRSFENGPRQAADVDGDGEADIIGFGRAFTFTALSQESIDGRNGNDTLIGDQGSDILSGNAGNDRLNGQQGRDTLQGGTGNDVLNGGEGIDRLFGDEGSDSLLGGNHGDLLIGGRGNDTLLGGNGNDDLLGEGGADSLNGQSGADNLVGGRGQDTLLGGNGNDDLNGGEEADRLNGQNGRDTLLGGFDNDTLLGGFGNDGLNGGEGADNLDGQHGNDTLLGDFGNDTLRGGFGNDLLGGGDNADFLVGGQGNDELNGGNGRDVLNGAGNGSFGVGERDSLTGGNGADRFILGDGDRSYYLDKGAGMISFARITDFELTDSIILHGSRSNYRLQERSGDTFIFRLEAGADDTIAIVENTVGLGLNEPQFVFM